MIFYHDPPAKSRRTNPLDMHGAFPYPQPMQRQVRIDVLTTGFEIHFLRPVEGKSFFGHTQALKREEALITVGAEVFAVSGAIRTFVGKMAATMSIGGVGNAL